MVGLVDRNLRSVIFLNSALFIGTYAGLLALVRQYLGKRLTPIPVLAVGVVWFSLADVGSSLWAFQVSWYLTLLFFVMMLVALSVPSHHRTVWFAVAALLACAASFSTIQGFFCWPVGAICILWNRPWASRARPEILVWSGALALTLAVYLPGYSFAEGNACFDRASCSFGGLAHHPLTTLGFFMTLIGNVIPNMQQPGLIPSVDVARFEVLGTVLLAVAVFILIQSWRHRASSQLLPLPLLLIVFALLFDASITVGRGGMGASGGTVNHYVMPNLVLLTGIVIYGLAHVPTRRQMGRGGWQLYVKCLALLALGIFVVVQVTATIDFGVTNGRTTDTLGRQEAQFFVNRNRIHVVDKSPSCQTQLSILLLSAPGASLRDAARDQLGEFQPASYRYYRKLGPWLPAACE